MELTASGRYIIKAKMKSSGGTGLVQLGFMTAQGNYFSNDIAIGNDWAAYSWEFIPSGNRTIQAIAFKITNNCTLWVDDFIAWDANDYDSETGFNKTFIDRLKELKPGVLRWGGLIVNTLHYWQAISLR